MSTYELLKLVHVSSVVISGLLFAYRFAWLWKFPEQSLAKVLKILPHINDTILLAAAIGMLSVIGLNPFVTPWLLAKILALVAYIVLGALCIRAKAGSRRQVAYFAAAVSVFAYILLVAVGKQVFPF